MAVEHAIVAVGTFPTQLSTGTSPGEGMPPQSHTVCLQNVGSATVYVGNYGGLTTSSYGFALAAGDSLSLDLANGEYLFGVVATSTVNVAVLRVNV